MSAFRTGESIAGYWHYWSGETRDGRFGSDVEADALRERQLAAVVDRVGRAAHVGLPCIGARLAPAAGFLLAAERAADLRAAGPDVHVDDAAVAAARRHEALGFADVIGEDARSEALRHGVVPCDHFLELAIRRRIQDRGEGLAMHDGGLPRHLHERRARVIPAAAAARRHALAAVNRAALLARLLERRLHPFERRSVDQRTHERAFVERISHGQRSVDLLEAGDELRVHALVDEKPPQRGAALPGRACGGEGDCAYGEVEVRA